MLAYFVEAEGGFEEGEARRRLRRGGVGSLEQPGAIAAGFLWGGGGGGRDVALEFWAVGERRIGGGWSCSGGGAAAEAGTRDRLGLEVRSGWV